MGRKGGRKRASGAALETRAEVAAAPAAAGDAEDPAARKRARLGRSGVREPPLSAGQVADFERDGFVLLRAAFQAETARACRQLLWERLASDGIHRERADSWVERHGIPECYTSEDADEWGEVVTPRLRDALDQLCGQERWQDFGLGWWMITFPDQAEPPWEAAGKWHVDGASYHHHVDSKESGLLAIFLLSDIAPGEGGTALAKGSHKWIARLLRDNEPRGLKGGAVSFYAREHFAKQLEVSSGDSIVVEVNGHAGDVMLVHPFLLHARSKNLGAKGIDSVRFMCNPNIRLHRKMVLDRADGNYSAVERAIRSALDEE